MTAVNIVVLSLTGICALATLFFVLRGLQARFAHSRHPYGVARQETRHDMQVNFLRAGFMLIITLILLGVYGLIPADGTVEATQTPSSTARPTQGVTATAIEETAAPPSPTPGSPTASATDLTVTQTPTPTVTLAASGTPAALTAVVNSPNGLWLREEPGGTQEVELIAHEAELELLSGRETVDDLDWQQVRTQAGNEGWVAAEFLIYP